MCLKNASCYCGFPLSLMVAIFTHLLSFLSFQVLGCGSVAQAVLSRGHLGGVITINIGFPMAVVMAIYVAAGVSGKYQKQ